MLKERNLTPSEFEGLVYNYLVKNQEKTGLSHWKEDEYEEFISWFYVRLHTAISVYKETGASFDSFISTVLRKSAKEYRTRTKTRSITEYSAWSIQVPELYAREEIPSYSYEMQKNSLSMLFKKNMRRKNPKQLLMLILKCYYHVSDDFLERVACHTGVNKKELKALVEKLRKKRSKREDHIYRMKERVYCQFYRCIVYEKRLRYLNDNSIAHLRLKAKLEKARQRLEKMRERISKIRTDATNREVAEVVGISKGAVDSGLHNLKTKLDVLLN
jgi:DNA-directed RNA polymerase specialized sigma24 family protein